MNTRFLRIGLAIIAGVSLLSCLSGMVGLILGEGAGASLDLLEGTPFSSYTWPGLLLGVVVGGSQFVALMAQIGRLKIAPALHVAAGLIMMIWIFGELAVLMYWSPLQAVFFAIGLLQVILAVIALGALPHPFFDRTVLTLTDDGIITESPRGGTSAAS